MKLELIIKIHLEKPTSASLLTAWTIIRLFAEPFLLGTYEIGTSDLVLRIGHREPQSRHGEKSG